MRLTDTVPRPWLPITLVALGAAAGTTAPRLVPLPTPTEAQTAMEKAAQENAAAEESARVTPTASQMSPRLRPVLDLLGESLGVSPEDQRIEAARSVRILLDYVGHARQHAATARLLAQLRARLDAGPPAFGSTADKARVLELLTLPVAGLDDDSEVAAARKQLLAFLKDEASDERLMRRLRDRARDTGVAVDFIVAGVADYVDSNVGWYADHQLEAIQAAMATAGFTFDRFHLADWPRDAKASAQTTHRTTPGAIVFRRKTDGRKQLRVVLLVPETPTAGLHREALRNALTLTRLWDDSARIRILGPMFSGSVDSLRRTIREDPAIWHRRKVQIVGGTATSASNRDTLVQDSDGWVDFSSTAHPFPEWLQALKRYLSTIEPAWAEGRSVAVLHESNTPFGLQAGARENQGVRDFFPGARRIAFPLHISRLRDAAADAAAGSPRSSLMSRVLIPLAARDDPTATDQLPMLTPDLTGASVQTAMASMFDSLRREKYRVVMIVATDERDALYLAREVRRKLPDTQLVLLGAQMLQLHPDYASYTRGALVVSSYSLSAAASNWGITEGTGRRQFFQTWTAQAIFNATLALLDEPRLVEYAVPTAQGADGRSERQGPPVWISTIGRTGFVPLATYRADGSDGFLYLQPHRPALVEAVRFGDALPLLTALLVVGLVAAICWHASVVVRQVGAFLLHPRLARTEGSACSRNWIADLKEQRVTGYRRVFVLPWRPFEIRYTASLFIHAVFGLLGLLTLWFGVLATWQYGWTSYAWAIASSVAVAAVPGLLVLTRQTGSCAEETAGAPRQGHLCAWIITLSIVGGVPALVALVPGSPADTRPLPFAALMEADRGLSLGSLVSPTVPVMCFALCAYIWLVWQLRVLSFVGSGYTTLFGDPPEPPAVPLAEPQPKVMAVGAGVRHHAGRPTAHALSGPAADAAVESDPTDHSGHVSLSASPHTQSASRTASSAPSMMSLLLSGDLSATPAGGSSALERWRRGFTRAFDATLPTADDEKHWGKAAARTALAAFPLVLVALVIWSRVYTLEGARFTVAFRVATLGCLALSTFAMAQTCVQWRRIGGALKRLGRSPMAPAFAKVHEYHLDWRLNLRLPRREELALLMAESDALESTFKRPSPLPGDVPLTSPRSVREKVGRELLLSSHLDADAKSLVDALERERHSDNLRLMNSETFAAVWRRTERYLPLLDKWFGAQGKVPDQLPHNVERPAGTGLEWFAADWFERAQGVVALTQAFVIRDALSRIVAGLSAACICFLLLLAAHLLYSFPGRSTLLTIDWMAVGLAGAIAVWILVAMERSVVLSHLWGSDPGRVSFNRDFVQRLALYGALPVLTLVSALFPEMGDTIFSWLAPARQLAGF